MSLALLTHPATLLILGAGIGILPTLYLERSKQKHALKTRWDAPLFEICKEFISTAREMVHLAMHLDRATDRADQERQLDLKHAALRSLCEQVRLLGNADVQTAARWVLRHCYAVRAVAEGQPDMRAKDHPGTTPVGRVRDALNDFVVAARDQLGVADPDDVPVDIVSSDEPWASKWYTDASGSES